MNFVYIAFAMLLSATGGFFYGDHVGSNSQLVKSQKVELAAANGKNTVLGTAIAKAQSDQLANEAKARKATADHEQALGNLQQRYDVLMAKQRAAGGLRITRTVCARPADSNKAASAGRPDGASTGTVELPAGVTEHLYALAKRGDELAEQLRSLQAWVKANGFYGEPDKVARMNRLELDLQTALAVIDERVIELMESEHDTRRLATSEN